MTAKWVQVLEDVLDQHPLEPGEQVVVRIGEDGEMSSIFFCGDRELYFTDEDE